MGKLEKARRDSRECCLINEKKGGDHGHQNLMWCHKILRQHLLVCRGLKICTRYDPGEKCQYNRCLNIVLYVRRYSSSWIAVLQPR